MCVSPANVNFYVSNLLRDCRPPNAGPDRLVTAERVTPGREVRDLPLVPAAGRFLLLPVTDTSQFRFQSCIEVHCDLLNALDLRRRQIEAALREIFPTREGSKFVKVFHAI